MKLVVKYPKFFTSLSVYLATVIRFLLNILLIVIIVALGVGVFKSGADLLTSLHKPLETLLQKMLLDIVFIVALVEIAITILGYLKDGSVHVRYIVDTILIIMLNEVVSIWFKDPSFEKSGSIALIIATLAVVRITVVKYAPTDKTEM
jgi:uncharacterized membrane protein (DUF373 family)